jgi:hypothetical protein
MKTFKEHWKQITQWYRFDRVKTTMDSLEWKWGTRTPSIAEIVESARELCEGVYINGGTRATGGFRAEYNKEEDVLSLEFVVENWSTEYWDSPAAD